MRKLMTRRVGVLMLVIASAGILVGSVVAAQWGGSTVHVDELQGAIEDAPMMKVADIGASVDHPSRGVFVQVTSTGHVCVWDAPSASSMERGGGCNPVDDPLGGTALSANLAYDGGPAIEGVRDARLSGLASEGVAAVRILMNDGTFRSVKLKKAKVAADEFQAFGYRFKKSDLKKGIGPGAIVAFDASGAEIDRQTTGIG